MNKVSESLSDYRYPIKEGDICMLYDGETVKTIYIDSERDTDSIWHDFKFLDTKSLKSYQFPKADSILCAPIGKKHAIGDTGLLTQLIQECKGEWLQDFLNETSAVLSGFVDYWDLGILRRLIGDDDISVAFEKEETLAEFIDSPKEELIDEEYDTDISDNEDIILSFDNNVRWFCLSALSSIEDLMDKRTYQILCDTIKGVPRKEIAEKHRLTQERIRQLVVKGTKQAKELLDELRKTLDEVKAENTQLMVRQNMLTEEIIALKALLPPEALLRQKDGDENFDQELADLLVTPINSLRLSVRASNVLISAKVEKFADIPQIESERKILQMRNSGRKTLIEIARMLEDFKLTFGMNFSEIVDVLIAKDWHAAKRKWIRDSQNNADIVEEKSSGEWSREYVLEGDARGKGPEEADSVMAEEATIVLTKDMIEAARTPSGGFTKSQLAAIGIAWPPQPDWIQEVVGIKITQAQYEAFNHIEYVKQTSPIYRKSSSKTYRDIASSPEDLRRMEAILQAMTHFEVPATTREIARTISRSAWGDGVVYEETVDSFLKRLPEVEYVQWGKYILKKK